MKAKLIEKICHLSIKMATGQSGLAGLIEKLRTLVPDISNQECTESKGFNDYWETKRGNCI